MNKRKLATLVAASFAGLMLSSPSFATDANKAQTTASASRAAESRSIERADKKATAPQASGDRATESAQDKAVASANAKTEAEDEYKAALEKCESQPNGQRSACVQDAEKAQTLAMQQSREGTSSSGAPQESHRTGTSKPSKPDASENRATERAEDKAVASANANTDAAPESRSIERADDKADKSDASRNTAMKNQTDSNTPNKTGAPEARVPGPQSAK